MKHKPLLLSVVAAMLLVLSAAGTSFGRSAAAPPSVTAAAGSTAGCGKAPALTSGNHTIQSGGQTRSYILRIPAGYDNNHSYRLIFGFHWRGGTAADVDSGGTDGYNWSYYGLRRLADNANNSTIFVAPQGNGNGWANSGGQDVAFVDAMVSQIEAGLCVDTTQLFSAGFSYGGAMSYALACARASVFRAVAVYSGANLSGCNGGTQPIAYMGLHGLRDNVLPIQSGRDLRDTFVRTNGCTPQYPPEPAYGSLTHIITTYAGCRSGYPVVWAAFDGAGHDPGPIDGSTGDGSAPSEAAATERFLEFSEKWGTKYPAVIKLWSDAWAEMVPFLSFDVEIRKVICSTNAIESVNARIRKAVRARGHFPSENAALKCVYMALMSLDPTGKGRRRWTMRWKAPLNAFQIAFEGRLTPTTSN
ncbi:transposase [Streptomyces sp900105755]|uniref:transposase n=1 Tax=Streptomyces sp. 900105755 TaxID=3154389 RepID=UPI00332C0C5E